LFPFRYEEEIVMKNATATAPVRHFGVGIDTSRYGHEVSFLREDRQPAAPRRTITETRQGYQQLQAALERLHQKHPHALFHVHLDAAGQYAANLESFLRSLQLPLQLSIGEPKRNKDYHKAFFPKRTSDATESQAMARFGVVEQPQATLAVPDEFYVLREIASRLQGQVKDTTRAVNRLHNLLARVFPELATIANDLTAHWVLRLLDKYPSAERIAKAQLGSLQKIPYIKADQAQQIHHAARNTVGTLRGELAESLVRQFVVQLQSCIKTEKELEKLLVQAFQALPPSGHVHIQSIPGIGRATAAVLVAKIVSISRFETPEKLVGYFGVFPEENTSGVDRWGNPIPPGTMQMSSKGADIVRRYLWNAAKSAIQCNRPVRDLYARLRAKGTRGDVALGHCMRKLLHQVFGVWVSNRSFDEHLAQPQQRPLSATAPSEPAPVPLDDGHDRQPAKTQMAAGHKRVNPQSKVVTAASPRVPQMPIPIQPHAGSIDYAWLRQQVTMEQVLRHLGYFDRLRGSGQERRGPCPLHDSQRQTSRSFTVHLGKNVYQCFHPDCSKGNVLDFWQAWHKLPLHQAALHLAETFRLQFARNTEQIRTERRGARNL
jgi:transposase